MNKEIHMFMDVPIYLKETKNSSYEELFSSGRKDGIRTHDLLVPNQARYPCATARKLPLSGDNGIYVIRIRIITAA